MNRVFPQNNEPTARTYKPEVLEALRTFRSSKPWRGSLDERKEKFQALHRRLCEIYGYDWKLVLDRIPEPEAEHGNGAARGGEVREIELTGKLSVVTYLFGFGAIVNHGNAALAREWAVTLYKRIFPRSAARMQFVNGFVIKPSNLN